MPLAIKFVGALRHFSGAAEITVGCSDGVTVQSVIDEITLRIPSLERSIFDKQFGRQKTIALILVNGREISALRGLDTLVKNGDEIVFIPVVHGG